MPVSNGVLGLGNNSLWGGEEFDGLIDEVRIYNRALSGSEIQSDMNSAVAGGAPPPPADTSPPSTPTNLAKTGATTSSIALSWTASTDNVGVVGYGLYLNGVGAGSTSSTSTSFSGLACGTSYTLAVDAYDNAGNRSGKASLSASTSACPPPPPPPPAGSAGAYLAPGGSDANPCTQAAPCASSTAATTSPSRARRSTSRPAPTQTRRSRPTRRRRRPRTSSSGPPPVRR